MEWLVFLIISTICLLSSAILAIVRTKTGEKSGKILFAGVALSSVILFVPIYVHTFRTTGCGIFETVLVSIHNMIRLFVVDGEFEFITTNLASSQAWINKGYSVLFSVLFVLAPILTFGFVLSFFKNVSAYRRYILHYNSDVYVFSELNERSLSLAESLKKKRSKKSLVVFTNMFEEEEEHIQELVARANGLGAVCFEKDIVTINFAFHSRNSELYFFTIDEESSENMSHAIKLVNKYKYRRNTNLYVFSTQAESEMLLAKAFESCDENIKIKVRRVNEVRSLIAENLYENGYNQIFQNAYDDGSGIKKINALVVGMGQHGAEMTKALSWFCQMEGYLVEINAFDIDACAEPKFAKTCPELMKFSGKLDIEGETKYTIKIHSEVDVESLNFYTIISKLPRTTYVFIALGNDEKNIATAVELRSVFERMGYSPKIQAVVYNSEKRNALSDISNFKGQRYNIDFIGDIKSMYSEEVILCSELEKKALQRHLKWGKESEFWQYDYNYKSSIASAIHREMKKLCGIPGIEKDPEERTEEELWSLRILEHCRWNAYMRSEGYVYSGSVNKETRNDLAKMHNCLVPFGELPLEEQEKDDN